MRVAYIKMGYVINVTLTGEAQTKRNLKAEWENGR